ncbi:MAG: Asp-tRNA(Asn)/Glu-tRNA(Gln) amidotransferase subunit GatC [Clostridia bacterium]|nr:Asp-tRNA(Asn)/Glu-tRNA(Gln) amidotransferase subunit GatC [Clostridia bacterium]MBR3955600.1 Asp-tRNA(Asn)/Glu-tRNA(Gln) amidotransferase subunit GatC [Clostridia bacterium]
MDALQMQRLEQLNRVALTEEERADTLVFFEKRFADMKTCDSVDTANTERMVHVLPLANVLRADEKKKLFSREDLLKGAPEHTDGYWQVPRLLE